MEVDEVTDIHAEATDPDGDVVKLSVTAYGVAHEKCDWAECGSVTYSNQSDGLAAVDFSISWLLPGKYTIRMFATDYKGELIVQDVPFFIYKIGDENRSAVCCKYNPEMPVFIPHVGLHHRKWTDAPWQYQVRRDANGSAHE